MVDLPANLDDGELWLPSDIFPAEEPHHHRRPIPNCRPRLEDLARQFNNLNFSDHRRRRINFLSPQAPPISKGLEVPGAMRAQYALTAPSENGCYGVKVGPTVDRALFRNSQFGLGPPVTIPAAPCQPFRYPTHHPQPQGTEAQLMETRIGSTSSNRRGQGNQNRHQNRLFPFQGKNFGFGFGCYFMKDCRRIGTHAGTGVFIPRATSDHKATSLDAGGKNQGVTPQRGHGRKLIGMDTADQEYYCCNPQLPSSDVRLPNDWTY